MWTSIESAGSSEMEGREIVSCLDIVLSWTFLTSGYSKSDPNRVNNSSLALTLIGIFLLGLPGTNLFVPGQNLICPATKSALSQDKIYFVLGQNLLYPGTTVLSRDKCFIPDYPTCNIHVTRCLGSFFEIVQ